jgi:hypothetical protein
MTRYLGAMMVVMGLLGVAYAADTQPATKPASGMPACCAEKCKAMGGTCCKTDAAGKTSCSMGGSCCGK